VAINPNLDIEEAIVEQASFRVEGDGDVLAIRRFDVVCATQVSIGRTIYEDDRIPKWNSVHPSDTTIRVKTVNVTPQDGSLKNFEVVVTYAQDLNEQEQPWLNNPVISYGVEYVDEVFERAYFEDGVGGAGDITNPTAAVLNTAGDLFDPPIIKSRPIVLIRVTVDVSREEYPPTLLLWYPNTVNALAVSIAGIPAFPKQALLKNIATDKKYTPSGVEYYTVSYDFLIDIRTHVSKILDRGFNAYFNVDGLVKKRPIKYSDIPNAAIEEGQIEDDPVRDPVLLDGAGGVLDEGNPFYIPYDAHYAADWAALPRFSDFSNYFYNTTNEDIRY